MNIYNFSVYCTKNRRFLGAKCTSFARATCLRHGGQTAKRQGSLCSLARLGHVIALRSLCWGHCVKRVKKDACDDKEHYPKMSRLQDYNSYLDI